MAELGFEGWKGQQRGDGRAHGFRLLPGWLEEWSQGQGLLLPWCLSGKSLRGFLWARVLVVAGGTSEGFVWVVEQCWEAITVIAPMRRTLIFCYT